MVEDPSLEIVETYSDWEYYSDDYYDDDPTIMAKQKTNGVAHTGEPRQKKRKLSSLENIPTLSLGSSVADSPAPMVNTFKGVLWRVPVKADDKIELYEPGKGEKVALLSDWRELFRTPTSGKPRSSQGLGQNARGVDKKNDENSDAGTISPAADRGEYNTGMKAKYVRYSPPSLEIENIDKSINRQRERLSQPELENLPSQPLGEAMVIADSEEEYEEESFSTLPVAEADVSGDDKENMVVSEKEEQPTSQMSVTVEIPSLATAMKRDTSNQGTPQGKRGRKPKKSPTTTKSAPTLNGSVVKNNQESKREAASKQTLTTKKRKKSPDAEVEDEQLVQNKNEDDNNVRRSKRVASSGKRRKV